MTTDDTFDGLQGGGAIIRHSSQNIAARKRGEILDYAMRETIPRGGGIVWQECRVEPLVTLRATATVYGYVPDHGPDCGPDCDDPDHETYDVIESGYVSLDNPYGSLLWDEPSGWDASRTDELDRRLSLREAARFVADFPNSV